MDFRVFFRRAGASVMAAALLCFAIASVAGSSAAAAGNSCTVKGTNGPDTLRGTSGRDVICGFGGDDRLIGRGGDDVLRGGPGRDVILAGNGNDRLLGQPDNDRLFGGQGNDYLDGGRGRNHLFTGPGDNKCIDKVTDTVTPGCDDTAPVITSLEADPQTDTFAAPGTVTVTLKMTDDLAGVRGTPIIEVSYLATNQRRWVGLSLISGDSLNPTYRGTVTLPRFSPQGRWDFHVSAVDNQDNYLNMDAGALKKAGFASGFDQVGAGDQSGPEFKTFEIDKATVDTLASSQTVNFRARVTDSVSGVALTSDFRPVEVILISTGEDASQIQANNMQLISGTGFDGIWEGSITFPQGSPSHVWNIRLGAIDYADNMSLVNHVELETRGLPHRIEVTNGAG